MPEIKLKGKFDLDTFKRKVERELELPYLDYIIGEGETLDYLFDTMITYLPLKNNKSVKESFKGRNGLNKDLLGKSKLEGETLRLNPDWLITSKNLPNEVKTAILEAERLIKESETAEAEHVRKRARK